MNCDVFHKCYRVKGEKGEAKKVPLSLEELLAKKKAEEEALSKVGSSARSRSDCFVVFVFRYHTCTTKS